MTEPKKYQVLDEADWKTKVDLIVDQLYIQQESREAVTGVVDALNAKYGIAKPLIRRVANVVFKKNKIQTEEENKEVIDLASICN